MARRLTAISTAMSAAAAAGTAASKTAAPYGAWKSPITSELITTGALRLGSPVVVNGYCWWSEGRPQEGGRQVLVRASLASNEVVDVTPAGFNVRCVLKALCMLHSPPARAQLQNSNSLITLERIFF